MMLREPPKLPAGAANVKDEFTKVIVLLKMMQQVYGLPDVKGFALERLALESLERARPKINAWTDDAGYVAAKKMDVFREVAKCALWGALQMAAACDAAGSSMEPLTPRRRLLCGIEWQDAVRRVLGFIQREASWAS